MTKFRATRNFLRAPGVDVVAGAVLELDDREASELVGLAAVEPVNAADRRRLVSTPRAIWESATERDERQRREEPPRLRFNPLPGRWAA